MVAVGMVVRVVVGMAMLVDAWPLRLCLLLPVHGHRHVCSGNTAGGALLRLQVHAGELQTVHPVQKPLLVIQKLVESSHEHIPGCTHVTFYIKCLHFLSSFMLSIWLIMLAR